MTCRLAGHFTVGRLRLRQVISFAGVPHGEGHCGEEFQFPGPAFEWVDGSGEVSPKSLQFQARVAQPGPSTPNVHPYEKDSCRGWQSNAEDSVLGLEAGGQH